MAFFIYLGVTSSGGQVKGEIQANSRDEVISLLRKKKIRTISIKKKPMSLSLSFGSGIKLSDVSRFTRQLSAMAAAGLPLVQCLDTLSGQTENKVLGKTVQQISIDIQGGNTLADALTKHPKIFNTLFSNMVAAGEASGNLDGVLTRLAGYLEKADSLRRKIKGAMTYPIVVGCVALGATIIMLTFIVPTFAQMFKDFGGNLPAPTKIILGLSNFVRAYLVHMAIAGVGIGFVISRYYKTPKGRYRIDDIKLHLPIFGDLERKSSISRFAQTLSTLLSSGITILDAIAITAKTAGNAVLERGLLRTSEKITGGQTIAEPLKETGVFPPMVIQMIAVGEKTGGLAEMLGKISEFYQEEVDAAVDALTSIIEPIMLVVIGIIVGGILVAMYLPMFEIIGTVG
ncbi:MAG: type II secretion system F family protein [Chitinivibrionales bacterium]|nr:type II secretion system F family protein [Chitinivibrionales bacterium]